MKAILYTRVSTSEQADSHLGLDAQTDRLNAECQHRGWDILAYFEDAGFSGGNMRRPGITEALGLLEKGEADVLVVSKLDRLTRSLADAVNLFSLADKQGWHLVALDLGVDTTTAAGRLVAHVMAAVAEWERQTISERTTAALDQLKVRGVQLGRPAVVSDLVVSDILGLRDEEGMSFRNIADFLNESGYPTAHGGEKWHKSTVRAIYERAKNAGSS